MALRSLRLCAFAPLRLCAFAPLRLCGECISLWMKTIHLSNFHT
jgi:hypothetical protein